MFTYSVTGFKNRVIEVQENNFIFLALCVRVILGLAFSVHRFSESTFTQFLFEIFCDCYKTFSSVPLPIAFDFLKTKVDFYDKKCA